MTWREQSRKGNKKVKQRRKKKKAKQTYDQIIRNEI